jgi:hypothetical protein
MLAWTIYISFLGVLVLMLLPRDAARFSAPKALNKIAQGNALGFGSQRFNQP